MPISIRRALIVTEDNDLIGGMSSMLEAAGVRAEAVSPHQAGSRIRGEADDCVIIDLDVEAADPIEIARVMDRGRRESRVLLLAGADSIERTTDAALLGIPGYIRKPFQAAELEQALRRLSRMRPSRPRIIGSSAGIQSALKLAEQVAEHNTHLTLVGPPGVGKRLLARLIHDRSPRGAAAFHVFSCDGFSERVIDGELFGRAEVDGSAAIEGLLRRCHRGTLVIDEIENLPVRSQERLLKCITLKSVRAPGGHAATSPADVRIIATTRVDLQDAVASGAFVRELYDRINGVEATLPSLMDRRSDIPMLADHFVRAGGHARGRHFKGIAEGALDRLMRHSWPGNVRELEDMVGQAVEQADGPWLLAEDLPALPAAAGAQGFSPGLTIQQIEKEAILRTLDAAGGSTGRAASILNISVRKIQYKLKEYRKESASTLRGETVRTVPSADAPAPVLKKKAVFVADVKRSDSSDH
jgi:two-component system NtrC family response regulator/two-component system response regulator HydG